MDKLVIEGGRPLKGEVTISGAKNASLPIIAAAILAEGDYTLHNVPGLRDIHTMNKLMETLGVKCTLENGSLSMSTPADCTLFEAPYEQVKTMRASVLVLGPLLAKRGKARVSLPGGCAIGARPVDLHIMALQKMGAHIEVNHGYLEAECNGLHGAEILFPTVTVGGTENTMMAAAIAKGTTIIRNAAREPEIVDLARMLRSMGAQIEGDGTATIKIHGVEKLNPTTYTVMSDRIEAGTFLCAVAGCGGNVTVKNAPVDAMTALVDKLREAGTSITELADGSLQVVRAGKLSGCDVTTVPHPGFPTDMQAQFMAVMTCADGTSVISEQIFENRYMHVPELQRMGANIVLRDKNAIIKGIDKLSGAPVMASDLRASAGLVIAALMAEGKSEVLRIYHLDRGYEAFDKKLAALGAQVTREKE